MNKDLADVLFESLDTIATHNNRLDKLDKTSKEVKASIDKLQSYLELKIEEATSSALKEVLDNDGYIDLHNCHVEHPRRPVNAAQSLVSSCVSSPYGG